MAPRLVEQQGAVGTCDGCRHCSSLGLSWQWLEQTITLTLSVVQRHSVARDRQH